MSDVFLRYVMRQNGMKIMHLVLQKTKIAIEQQHDQYRALYRIFVPFYGSLENK